MRNFNTTPVFAYYKEQCSAPFVYKMPIFTEELFEAFLRITGGLSLMDMKTFNRAIEDRQAA